MCIDWNMLGFLKLCLSVRCVYVSVCMWVCVCVRACVRACVRVCVVCNLDFVTVTTFWCLNSIVNEMYLLYTQYI